MTEESRIEKARLYEKYRLPYPRAIVDDLLRQIDTTPVIADIGAGTGQLARMFAGKCKQIYAIEPDLAMRHVAHEACRGYRDITIIDASAEHTTLHEASVDLIVIGNAYHRFRPEAIDELLRVLTSSGWIALVSYVFKDRSFSDMLFPRLSQLKSFVSRSEQNWHRMPVENLFKDKPLHTVSYSQSQAEDWDAFWGAARSGIEAPVPTDEEFARFEEINREVFDACAVGGQIRIDYETRVLYGQPKAYSG